MYKTREGFGGIRKVITLQPEDFNIEKKFPGLDTDGIINKPFPNVKLKEDEFQLYYRRKGKYFFRNKDGVKISLVGGPELTASMQAFAQTLGEYKVSIISMCFK